MPTRTLLVGLGVIGLALVGTGALALKNWETVSKNLMEASEKTEATLFRWGELGSIGAELKRRYGTDPEMTYDTSTGSRTLNIRLRNYKLPEQVTSEGHAREIAAFALGNTTKREQIDAVRVLFQNPSRNGIVEAADGSLSYTFGLNDMPPSQPQVRPAAPDHSAAGRG